MSKIDEGKKLKAKLQEWQSKLPGLKKELTEKTKAQAGLNEAMVEAEALGKGLKKKEEEAEKNQNEIERLKGEIEKSQRSIDIIKERAEQIRPEILKELKKKYRPELERNIKAYGKKLKEAASLEEKVKVRKQEIIREVLDAIPGLRARDYAETVPLGFRPILTGGPFQPEGLTQYRHFLKECEEQGIKIE